MASSLIDTSPLEGGLTEVAIDARTHLLRVWGDASSVRREMRTAAVGAIAAGRTVLVVDMSESTGVGALVAQELVHLHERLLWRAGWAVVIFEPSVLGPLFDALGPHRSPDVVTTLGAGLAAAHVSPARLAATRSPVNERAPASSPASQGDGAGVAEALASFVWQRHEHVPASSTHGALAHESAELAG